MRRLAAANRMHEWPHAPAHKLAEAGAYMVTSGTYGKQHLFDTPAKLTHLRDRLFELAAQFGWLLQAWAVLSNHYHFIALAPKNPQSLQALVRHLHSVTARELNRTDITPGRKVWFQYWDSHITFENSYRARINYVHRNAVHHGLVTDPTEYAWCSAGWFARTASPECHRTISSFPIEKLTVKDDF